MIELSAMLVGDIRVAKNTSVTIYNYDLDCHCPDSVPYECGLLLKPVCVLRNAAQSPGTPPFCSGKRPALLVRPGILGS